MVVVVVVVVVVGVIIVVVLVVVVVVVVVAVVVVVVVSEPILKPLFHLFCITIDHQNYLIFLDTTLAAICRLYYRC